MFVRNIVSYQRSIIFADKLYIFMLKIVRTKSYILTYSAMFSNRISVSFLVNVSVVTMFSFEYFVYDSFI